VVQTCSDKPDSSPSARPDELHAKLREGVGANEIWQEAGYAVKKNKAVVVFSDIFFPSVFFGMAATFIDSATLKFRGDVRNIYQ